ncbi:hypothetical protein [Chroococcidiopsis sp.]|uniref:hypothetical protein n=1 Tax=Chroococcidiopsis sp. TaxID=3088168 RepID=UPI003F40430A
MQMLQAIVSGVRGDFLKQVIISETFSQIDDLAQRLKTLEAEAKMVQDRIAKDGFNACGIYILLHDVEGGTCRNIELGFDNTPSCLLN